MVMLAAKYCRKNSCALIEQEMFTFLADLIA
jgi:hypothetical protein